MYKRASFARLLKNDITQVRGVLVYRHAGARPNMMAYTKYDRGSVTCVMNLLKEKAQIQKGWKYMLLGDD